MVTSRVSAVKRSGGVGLRSPHPVMARLMARREREILEQTVRTLAEQAAVWWVSGLGVTPGTGHTRELAPPGKPSL